MGTYGVGVYLIAAVCCPSLGTSMQRYIALGRAITALGKNLAQPQGVSCPSLYFGDLYREVTCEGNLMHHARGS